MADIVIRPSSKFIKAGFALVVLLIVAAVVIHIEFLADRQQPPWLPVVASLLLIWPIERLIRRQAVKLTISGDKLRYEVGLCSKSTRIIFLRWIRPVA